MAKKKNELVSLRRSEREDESKRPGRPQLVDYLRPWVGVPLLIPAGFITHWLWGEAGWATGLASAAITAAGGVVSYVTHRLTDARSWYAHHIATAMTGGAAAWLAAATAFGPGRPLMDMLLIGGATLAAIANVHTWAAAQGATEKPATGWQRPSWSKVAETLRLKGVSMRVKEETETGLKGTLSFEDGQTIDDIQNRRKELASMYKVAPGAVRITEDEHRADRAELTIITRDVMGELLPWPGLKPEHVGASIADAPLELGLYEDGRVFTDEIDDRHTLTCGMSGAGKSVYGKVKIVQIAARRDTFVCAIDMSKGRQTLGPVKNALGWTAYDKKSARALLEGIKRAVTARANHLGDQSLPGWTKGCGLTFLHVLIEEAADLVDFDELVALMRAARSTGIHMEVSLQRASFGNIDTDARANLGDGICFGVRDEADARFALPEMVTDAGAEPHRWAKTRPGSAYAAIEHADTDRWTTPVKMYGPPTARKADENNELTPASESLPDQDGKLDEVTRAAFGEPYAKWLAGAGAPAVTEGEDEEEEETEEGDDVDPIVLDLSDDDPDVTGDINTEIAPVDGEDELVLSTPKKGTQASAKESREALDSLLAEWGTGHTFKATELRSELEEMGVTRRRTWFYDQLGRLEREGRVVQDDDGNWTVQETRALASV